MVVPQKGDYVWIERKNDVAIGARIKDIVREEITVIDDKDEEYVLRMGTKLRHMHVSSINGVEDMILLGDLNEAGILRNLYCRYKRREIYTYTGNILVAVNPYEDLPIYRQAEVQLYRGNAAMLHKLPPHIFAVAGNSHYSLLKFRIGQAIIVSGESGAGKTESTKLMLQQLAAVSGQHSWIEQQILDSNPILEAFGNAKTIRNDNSSRFGKFVDVEFNVALSGTGTNNGVAGGSIQAAEIQQFLLEKCRIVSQAVDERNYHVFYCLFEPNSLDIAIRQKLGLDCSSSDFNYLNQGGVGDLKSSDIVDYSSLRSAMKVLLFTDQECMDIFQLLAAFLHLGNVTFQQGQQTNNTDCCTPIPSKSWSKALDLLQVDAASLTKALTKKTMITREEILEICVSCDAAVNVRDAFVKGCYGRIFLMVVDKINSAIRRPGNKAAFTTTNKNLGCIGILDIFGFENFTSNSFEQLCINYANESLQQFFVQHVFKLEQEEYNAENVNWKDVPFVDNQETLDLLAGRSCNVLALIDEESGFPRGTDESLLVKMAAAHHRNGIFIKHKSDKAQIFGIQHFAGPVYYSVEGFLEKNRDVFNADLIDLVKTSKNSLLVKLFEKDLKMGFETRKKAPSLIIQFRRSLEHLMRLLVERQPHFVRCIKPNEFKQPRQFDRLLCLRQLRYSGMMETIRVRKAGYPIRHKFADFIDRYRVLVPGVKSSRLCKDTRSTTKDLCLRILESALYQVGSTKLFLKESGDIYLEERRDQVLAKSVLVIQKCWRGFKQRRLYIRRKKASAIIQRNCRMYQNRRRFNKIRRGISLLQAAFRAKLASKKLKDLKGFVRNIQRFCRGKLAREKVKKKKRAIVKIQSLVRGLISRRHVRNMKIDRKKMEEVIRLRKEEEKILQKQMDEEKAKEEADKRQKMRMEEIRSKEEEDERVLKQETEQKKQQIKDAETRLNKPVDESKTVEEIFGDVGTIRGKGPQAFEDLELEGQRKTQQKSRRSEEVSLKYDYADIVLPGSLASDAREFPFSKFAATYFQPGQDTEMVRRGLSRPLLHHALAGDRVAALAVWIVILRFTRDLPDPPSITAARNNNAEGGSVMSRIYASLGRRFDSTKITAIGAGESSSTLAVTPYERVQPSRKNIVSLTLKKKSKFTEEVVAQLRSTQQQNDSSLTAPSVSSNHDDMMHKLLDEHPPITSLEKLHFIIGHGILRPQLRDEIYCQLIKQQQANNTNNTARGLVLLALCLGCFAPSEKLVRPLRGIFHTKYSPQLAQYLAIRLQRTLSNGTRNQPPSWIELRSVKKRLASIELNVTSMDGRTHTIYADSASTSQEICNNISQKLGLKDWFGFSLFIAILDKVSSMGSGSDHVMDAISQCEQFASERGISESRAQWRLFYRKEIFSPWHNLTSEQDLVATDLIFCQVCRGVKYGEYKCDSDEELAKLAIYQARVDKLKNISTNQEQLLKYIPTFALGTTKERRNSWIKLLSKIDKETNGVLSEQSTDNLKLEVVKFARLKWPMLFSRFYEAVKFSGPSLETNDVIITINWTGVYLVDSSERIHLELPFTEIVGVSSSRTSRLHGQTLSLSTMKGDTFTFNSTNAEDVRDLIVLFLEGLKQRSKYLVALESFTKPDPSFLQCDKGDLVILADEFLGVHTSTRNLAEWWYGENQRTKAVGDFPAEIMYILPTLSMPSAALLALFADRNEALDEEDHATQNNSQTKRSVQVKRPQHTLEEYSKLHFRSTNEPAPSNPLWCHSTQMLRAPLLRRLLPREDLCSIATQSCFLGILRYMGDQPSSQYNNISSAELTELIFEPCLKQEALKDEVYCQIIKQITFNHNPQSEKAGWELLWLATGIMSPSSGLYRELIELFRTSRSPHGSDCLNRLQKIIKSGQRRYAPHPIEINAVQMGKIIHHKIYFPNETSEAFEVTSTTKCKDLCQAICIRTGISEMRGLALFVKSADKAISMPDGDFFFDFLRQLSDWVMRHRPARDNKLDFTYQVFFMRKLWSDITPGQDKTADLILHYPQEVRKYLYGYHKVSLTDAATIGSYIARSTYEADANTVNHTLSQIESFVPADLVPKINPQEMKDKIMNQYLSHSFKTAEEAKMQFLKWIFQWPTFGSAFFEVKQSTNSNIPEKILIAINKNGVYLIHCKSKEILDHYPYSSISNWSSGNTYFNMTIGNLIHGRKLLCETPLGYKMDDLLTSYISLMLTNITNGDK